MTRIELSQWVEAIASCAIEGNKLAEHMMGLWNSGQRAQFMKELLSMMEKPNDSQNVKKE